MTEKGLDDSRVDGVEERTRCEGPTSASGSYHYRHSRGFLGLLGLGERSVETKIVDEEVSGEPLSGQSTNKRDLFWETWGVGYVPRCKW